APYDIRACHFFFFFQAEDGIRDFHVTGVQTCALPISLVDRGKGLRIAEVSRLRASVERVGHRIAKRAADRHAFVRPARVRDLERSEERRVGKEWSCRWVEQRALKKKTTET